MSQQEFDNFKQRIKDWMDSHPEEYDCFEEEMNRKDNSGYQKILTMAFTLIPKYQKDIQKRANQGFYIDISDIETLFSESNLAKTLISEFNDVTENSIVPAMLSWLYFGQSFERMVERGEELRCNPESGYVDRLFITSTIKMLISKSISLGLRTKADWEKHNELMKLANSKDVLDWAIKGDPNEKKKSGRKSDKQTLPEMLSSSTSEEKPDNLIKRIENFLKDKHTQYDIACLKIVLEELSYMQHCDVRPFRDALEKEYGESIHIVSERGIQESYKKLNEFIGQGKLVKELNENLIYIQNIKEILSD